ncbi:hypothetical protein Tco_0190899 [Tanacetum coccineum]
MDGARDGWDMGWRRWRVEESDSGDRVDRLIRSIFGLGRKSHRKSKANIVVDALSRKERMKPRRAQDMSMIIHSSIKARILEAQSEASKGANTPAEMLKGLDKQFERKEDGGLYLAERI